MHLLGLQPAGTYCSASADSNAIGQPFFVIHAGTYWSASADSNVIGQPFFVIRAGTHRSASADSNAIGQPFFVISLSNRPDNPRRVTCNNYIIRHILQHNRTCANNTVFANRNAAQYRNTAAK
jgi:hypothetical protein